MLGLKGIEITVANKPLLGEIIESLPGFGQAAEIARQARALRDAIPKPDPVDSPLNTGESVAEWIERATAAEVGIQEAATRRRLLHRLADEAENLAGSIFSANGEHPTGAITADTTSPARSARTSSACQHEIRRVSSWLQALDP